MFEHIHINGHICRYCGRDSKRDQQQVQIKNLQVRLSLNFAVYKMDLSTRTSITDSLQYLTDSISFTSSQRHSSLGSPTNSESGESSLVSPIKPGFFSQICYRNEIEITGNFIAQFLYGKMPRLRVNNWISKIQRHLFTAIRAGFFEKTFLFALLSVEKTSSRLF